ncbi:signal peptidase I [Sphingomonas sp.]|uniref:signal peptidase I n=1 Tax=Sphingomonas sp. TaxID=28214 RepID=UPI001D3A24B5|nr:signal peptidase I [Sphingomonas sp.]MBX9796538.1 signal peptidase I [Sphingomonas sp.]
MDDPATATPTPAGTPAPAAARPGFFAEVRDLLWFLVRLVVIVVLFRSFLLSPFVIPSESMLPRLLVGDYLFVSKWNYGYSRHSLPFSWPLIPGRVLPGMPTRGDIAVFKAPPGNRDDYIKRVIGLPGDSIQMVSGQIILNGRPVPQVPMADFVLPLTPNYSEKDCPAAFQEQVKGKAYCRYRQYRETLPNGVSYAVLDRGPSLADNTPVFHVPGGHVFMMGDNRDDSADSRFPPVAGQGIGYVPLENLEGRALFMFYSTDGSASLLLPWTWFSATRWQRLGRGF